MPKNLLELKLINERVVDFYYELDMSLEFSPYIVQFKSLLTPLNSLELILSPGGETANIHSLVPEVHLYKRLVFTYGEKIVNHWRKIQKQMGIKKALIFFFWFLFCERNGLFMQALEAKKDGFSLDKTFQPMHQLYFKGSAKSAYDFLRQSFN